MKITKELFGRQLPIKAKYIIEGRKNCKEKQSVTGWLNVSLNKAFNTNIQLIYNKIGKPFLFVSHKLENSIKSIKDTTLRNVVEIPNKTDIVNFIKNNQGVFTEKISKFLHYDIDKLRSFLIRLSEDGDIRQGEPDRWWVD